MHLATDVEYSSDDGDTAVKQKARRRVKVPKGKFWTAAHTMLGDELPVELPLKEGE